MIEIIRRSATGAVAVEIVGQLPKPRDHEEYRDTRLLARDVFSDRRWEWQGEGRKCSKRNNGRKPPKRFRRVSIRTACMHPATMA